MIAATDGREPVWLRLVASGCAVALCVALHFAQRYRIVGVFGGDQVLGMLGVMSVALPWLQPQLRSRVVLGFSLLIAGWLLRALLVVPLAFTWLSLQAVEWPWTRAKKLCLLLGVWLGVTVVGWFVIPYLGRYAILAGYWGSLPAAIIWLVLDHERGRLAGFSRLERALYFLAFPRFCTPFIHPIGAARLLRSFSGTFSPWLPVRALLLGLCGIGAFWLIRNTHFAAMSSTDVFSLSEHGPRVFRNGVHIYAYNCSSIFLAVAMFRLGGYNLGSGFNWPGLSSSPSEFFRRWNYYFFDFANNVIFVPLASRLRRWLPLWLAYAIGGYASFALGVWVLDIISRLPQTPQGTWAAFTNVHDLRVHLVFWTLIIGAQLLIMPARRLRRFWWWKAAGHLGTWGLAIGGLVWLFVTQNRLY